MNPATIVCFGDCACSVVAAMIAMLKENTGLESFRPTELLPLIAFGSKCIPLFSALKALSIGTKLVDVPRFFLLCFPVKLRLSVFN